MCEAAATSSTPSECWARPEKPASSSSLHAHGNGNPPDQRGARSPTERPARRRRTAPHHPCACADGRPGLAGRRVSRRCAHRSRFSSAAWRILRAPPSEGHSGPGDARARRSLQRRPAVCQCHQLSRRDRIRARPSMVCSSRRIAGSRFPRVSSIKRSRMRADKYSTTALESGGRSYTESTAVRCGRGNADASRKRRLVE
jgi:hypothetical protein